MDLGSIHYCDLLSSIFLLLLDRSSTGKIFPLGQILSYKSIRIVFPSPSDIFSSSILFGSRIGKIRAITVLF